MLFIISLAASCGPLPDGGLGGAAGVEEPTEEVIEEPTEEPQVHFFKKPTLQIYPSDEGESLYKLSITPVGLGNYQITFPKKIILGQSGIIDLIVVHPDVSISHSKSPSNSSQNLSMEIFQDTVEIYPLMKAELTGSKEFDIAPSGNSEKAVLSTSHTQWKWIVTPKTIGNQVLLLTISLPIMVDDEPSEYGLKSLSLMITVEDLPLSVPASTSLPTPTHIPSLSEQIRGSALDSVGTITIALATIITTILAVLKFREDKKKNDDERLEKERKLGLNKDQAATKAEFRSIEERGKTIREQRRKESQKKNSTTKSQNNKTIDIYQS